MIDALRNHVQCLAASVIHSFPLTISLSFIL